MTYTQAYVYNDTGSVSGGTSVMFSSLGDRSPTPTFYDVAESNRESRNLGSALVRLVSTDIRMIRGRDGSSRNSLPSGVSSWTRGTADAGAYRDYIYSIQPTVSKGGLNDTTYSDVLIGYFAPLLADNSSATFVDGLHFMIVNGSWTGSAADAAQWYHILFDFGTSDFDSLVRLSRDTEKSELVALMPVGGSRYSLDLNLESGTGNLFGVWDSSNPLPTIPEPGTFVLMVTAMIGALVQPAKAEVNYGERQTFLESFRDT